MAPQVIRLDATTSRAVVRVVVPAAVVLGVDESLVPVVGGRLVAAHLLDVDGVAEAVHRFLLLGRDGSARLDHVTKMRSRRSECRSRPAGASLAARFRRCRTRRRVISRRIPRATEGATSSTDANSEGVRTTSVIGVSAVTAAVRRPLAARSAISPMNCPRSIAPTGRPPIVATARPATTAKHSRPSSPFPAEHPSRTDLDPGDEPVDLAELARAVHPAKTSISGEVGNPLGWTLQS